MPQLHKSKTLEGMICVSHWFAFLCAVVVLEFVESHSEASTKLLRPGGPPAGQHGAPSIMPTSEPTEGVSIMPSLIPTLQPRDSTKRNAPILISGRNSGGASFAVDTPTTPLVAPTVSRTRKKSTGIQPRNNALRVPPMTPSTLCTKGARQTSAEGATTSSENPIAIMGFDGETVTFSLTQVWTAGRSVDWVATVYTSNDGNERCDKENSVAPKRTHSYTAFCVKKWAQASVYVYDKNLNTTDNIIVPTFCGDDVAVKGNKVVYHFKIPCDCDGLSSINVSLSPAPTSSCDYYNINFNDKDMAPGSYVSREWEQYGLRVTAKEIHAKGGGHMPNGYPRLFDTSSPVDSTGYGTPALAANVGNVLVVQQTGDNVQWKANQKGGIMIFQFLIPVKEFLEVGLMNVVDEAVIEATDADGATRSFSVEPKGSTHYREVVMDVLMVLKLVVKMNGPLAVSHVSICSDFASTSTNDSWPIDATSTVPSKSPPSSKPFLSEFLVQIPPQIRLQE